MSANVYVNQDTANPYRVTVDLLGQSESIADRTTPMGYALLGVLDSLGIASNTDLRKPRSSTRMELLGSVAIARSCVGDSYFGSRLEAVRDGAMQLAEPGSADARQIPGILRTLAQRKLPERLADDAPLSVVVGDVVLTFADAVHSTGVDVHIDETTFRPIPAQPTGRDREGVE